MSLPLTVARTAGLLAMMTIAVLSLVPGYLRPSVPFGFQHFIAYFITAILLSVGFRNRNPVAIAALMSVYALVLEITQNIIPGRTPALTDFAEGTIGAVAGIIVVRFVLSIRERFSA
jgi:VanZ family protein